MTTWKNLKYDPQGILVFEETIDWAAGTYERKENDVVVESRAATASEMTLASPGYNISNHAVRDLGWKAEPPYDLDFQKQLKQRLHPDHTMVKGEIQQTIHYAGATLEQDGTVTYDTPVVQEDFAYLRTASGLAVMRTHTICWFFADGTLDTTNKKILTKYYNNIEMFLRHLFLFDGNKKGKTLSLR